MKFLHALGSLVVMDLARPIEAVIPGAQGQLLAALVCAGRELSTKTVAQIAGVSAPHASRVLANLVSLGIVQRRDVPPVALYSMTTGSAVADLLRDLNGLRGRVFSEMASAAVEMSPQPVEVTVFGSVARGESDADSDIDVLLVAPNGALDTDEWTSSVITWTKRISEFAASPTQVIEVDEHQRRTSPDNALWRGIRRDGIVVFPRKATFR